MSGNIGNGGAEARSVIVGIRAVPNVTSATVRRLNFNMMIAP